MSEFCVNYWNELNETDYPAEAYVLSCDFELCEGCGEWKQIIITQRKRYFLRLLIKQLLKW